MQEIYEHTSTYEPDLNVENIDTGINTVEESDDTKKSYEDELEDTGNSTLNTTAFGHAGEPAPSKSWETLSSCEDGYDAELYGPGSLYIQTNLNFVNTIRHVSWSVRSTVKRRSTSQKLQIDEESALALLNRPCPNYEIKCKEILNYITKNTLASDLKISLYMVASEAASLLKPFPKCLVDESNEGIVALGLINEEIPSVNLIKQYLQQPDLFRVSDSVVNLLHWLLVYEKDPRIQCIPPECFYSIFLKVKKSMNYDEPTHVFKLMASRSSAVECKWRALKEGRKSSFAFYSENLKLMHSVVHLGFHPLTFTEGKYGNGLYFFTDLQHCLEKTNEDGWCWGKSELGRQLKTALVVEILEHSDCKMYDELNPINNDKALTNGEPLQELPSYFVPRSELVRLRYLLVFGKRLPNISPAVVSIKPKETTRNWLAENKKVCLIIGSLLVLTASAHYLYVNKNIRHEFFSSKLSFLNRPVSTV